MCWKENDLIVVKRKTEKANVSIYLSELNSRLQNLILSFAQEFKESYFRKNL